MGDLKRATVRRRAVIGALALASATVWPGTGPVQAQAADCAPNGSALSITAFDTKFDKDCLAAPAGQPFTVDFNNLDRGIPHNLAIYENATAQKEFFKGDLVDGPGKATYSVPAVPEGIFFFRCDPHPQMKGTFVSAG